MEVVMKHFDFLVSITKASSIKEASKLLKEASDEEIKALLDCLSLRTQVKSPVVTTKEIKLLKATKRRKRIRAFLERQIKFIVPMLVVVLGKAINEVLDCVCDMS